MCIILIMYKKKNYILKIQNSKYIINVYMLGQW